MCVYTCLCLSFSQSFLKSLKYVPHPSSLRDRRPVRKNQYALVNHLYVKERKSPAVHLLLTRTGFVVLSLSQFAEVFGSTEWRILGMQAHSDVLVSQKLTAHNATGMILCTSQMLIGSQVGLNRKMTSSWSGNTKWTFFIVFNTDVHFNLLNVTTVVLSAAGWRTSNNTNSHSPHTGDSKLL